LLECGYIRSHNLSGAKAPARRGSLLECGYILSHNLSGAKAPARRGSLF